MSRIHALPEGHFGADASDTLLYAAVYLGMFENRLMNASKLADYVGVPRSTMDLDTRADWLAHEADATLGRSDRQLARSQEGDADQARHGGLSHLSSGVVDAARFDRWQAHMIVDDACDPARMSAWKRWCQGRNRILAYRLEKPSFS